MALVRSLVTRPGNEDGQGLVEYALILTLIVIVAISALILIGGSLQTTLSMVGKSV